MFSKNNILAVVPARGGSKGVPYKNIYPLGGKPLIVWTLDCLKKMKNDIKIIVSTDDKKIANIVKKNGIDVPFYRPKNISGDHAGDWEVIKHSLLQTEKIFSETYDTILMLQPTSPFRTPKQINAVLEHLYNGNYDSVWTVSETDLKYHPIKQMIIVNDCLKYKFTDGNLLPRRQDLESIFHVNGVAYAFTRDCILKQKSRMGKRTAPYLIKEKVVNIDSLEDFKIAEKYIEIFKNLKNS